MFPLVYEINTRIWLKKLSAIHNRAITLGNVPDSEFVFFASSGFDIVWLMGVWNPSLYSKSIATAHPGLRTSFFEHVDEIAPGDIASSPYSIPSYTVSDLLGGKDELVKFREKLHAYGIKLMLDFVPNHLALDNEWLPKHPEYFISLPRAEWVHDPGAGFEYVHGKYLACGKDPFFAPWTDTLQLNYARHETHEMMTGNLLKISDLCDAVRCDVAMLVLKSVFNSTWSRLSGPMPHEFWSNAIATVKARHPGFIFLAESYWNKEWELQQLGFDFTYDMPFYDFISSAPVNVEKLSGHLKGQWDYQKHLCRFIENHDEQRAAEKIGLNNKAAALVFLAAPGMHLVHQDQMSGYHKKIPVQLLKQAPEINDTDLEELYGKLFQLQKKPLFQEGQISWLEVNTSCSSHCFGFQRFLGNEYAFVLANFTATGITMEFRHPSPENLDIDVLNYISSEDVDKSADMTYDAPFFHVRLSPHEAVVITP